MPADTDLEIRGLIVRYLTINNQLLRTYQQHKTGKRQRMRFVDQILCQWGILQQLTFQGWTMLPMSTLVNTARLWFSLWSKIDPVDRKIVMIWSFKRNDKCFQNLQWVLKEFRSQCMFQNPSYTWRRGQQVGKPARSRFCKREKRLLKTCACNSILVI